MTHDQIVYLFWFSVATWIVAVTTVIRFYRLETWRKRAQIEILQLQAEVAASRTTLGLIQIEYNTTLANFTVVLNNLIDTYHLDGSGDPYRPTVPYTIPTSTR